MTLDDLLKVFDEGFKAKLASENYPHEAFGTPTLNRAGVVAVVKAIRDDICERYGENSARDLANEFNSILDVVVAEHDDNSLICEWTDLGPEWSSSCKVRFGAFSSTKGRFFCPSCGKPIEFGKVNFSATVG